MECCCGGALESPVAQCTWVSLTGLIEKVWVGQVDLTITTRLLGMTFKVKVYGKEKFDIRGYQDVIWFG